MGYKGVQKDIGILGGKEEYWEMRVYKGILRDEGVQRNIGRRGGPEQYLEIIIMKKHVPDSSWIRRRSNPSQQ